MKIKMERAYIQVFIGDTEIPEETIQVLFNPAEYTLDKSNQFQSASVLGLSAPLTQFVNGNAETLTMDLFVDTYEDGEDARLYTSKLMKLVSINKELHAPPICRFVWGKFQFKSTVEKISRKFTMFTADGTPVRAVLNVTFKEYKTLSELISHPPLESTDRTKVRALTEGDSLWLMASREYGNPEQWKIIAEANNIDNPRIVKAGTELRLPPVV